MEIWFEFVQPVHFRRFYDLAQKKCHNIKREILCSCRNNVQTTHFDWHKLNAHWSGPRSIIKVSSVCTNWNVWIFCVVLIWWNHIKLSCTNSLSEWVSDLTMLVISRVTKGTEIPSTIFTVDKFPLDRMWIEDAIVGVDGFSSGASVRAPSVHRIVVQMLYNRPTILLLL